jgi:hypothetical protein
LAERDRRPGRGRAIVARSYRVQPKICVTETIGPLGLFIMDVVVSLKEIVDAIDLPNDGWVSYLNPHTGEIVTVTDEDRRLAEDEDVDEERLPEWERESLHIARAVLESGDCLALPSKFEIHEWAIMERFSNSQAHQDQRDELLDAIHGAGAFRSFRSTIRRLGIEDEWFAFRRSAFEEVAKDWLEAHEIPYL